MLWLEEKKKALLRKKTATGFPFPVDKVG
jgi:hypothetical protein